MIPIVFVLHLGIRKAGMKYVRFRNPDEPKQSEIMTLIERIRAEISVGNTPIIRSTAPPHHEPLNEPVRPQNDVTERPPIAQWRVDEIERWFQQHGIMEDIYELYRFRSGTEMLDYARILAKNRDEQQKVYTQIFAQKYGGQLLPPHEFHRFANAMEELRKENAIEHPDDQQSAPSMALKSNKPSSTCILV